MANLADEYGTDVEIYIQRRVVRRGADVSSRLKQRWSSC